MKLDKETIRNEAKAINFEWQSFFTPGELDRLARETGFCKRNGNKTKISGATFFDLIVMNRDILSDQSLNDLRDELLRKKGIRMAAQSMNERFNDASVTFFKTVLKRIICKQIDSKIIEHKLPFKRILIKDSTCFQISDALAETYPGSGGTGSKASLRIQFEFDLLSSTVTDLSLTAFNVQDSTDSKMTLDNIAEGDLIVRDLGYMYKDVFEGIAQRKAAFLCRLGHNTIVYDEKSKKIEFKEILEYMRKCRISKLEKKIYLADSDLPLRLFIYLLPEDVVEKRLREKNEEAKRKCRKLPSEEYKIRQHFNLIITNVQSDAIIMDTAYEIYRLRWQLELIFKTWKSLCSIDRVKPVKKQRLECYVFAKLIILMMGWKIYWKLSAAYYEKFKCMLSQFKFFKTFNRRIQDLSKVLMLKMSFEEILESFDNCIHTLIINVKKGKKASLEMIKTIFCLNVSNEFVNNRN